MLLHHDISVTDRLPVPASLPRTATFCPGVTIKYSTAMFGRNELVALAVGVPSPITKRTPPVPATKLVPDTASRIWRVYAPNAVEAADAPPAALKATFCDAPCREEVSLLQKLDMTYSQFFGLPAYPKICRSFPCAARQAAACDRAEQGALRDGPEKPASELPSRWANDLIAYAFGFRESPISTLRILSWLPSLKLSAL
jgi:hypothetical protein